MIFICFLPQSQTKISLFLAPFPLKFVFIFPYPWTRMDIFRTRYRVFLWVTRRVTVQVKVPQETWNNTHFLVPLSSVPRNVWQTPATWRLVSGRSSDEAPVTLAYKLILSTVSRCQTEAAEQDITIILSVYCFQEPSTIELKLSVLTQSPRFAFQSVCGSIIVVAEWFHRVFLRIHPLSPTCCIMSCSVSCDNVQQNPGRSVAPRS